MLSQVCIHILHSKAVMYNWSREKKRGWIIEHRWSNINPYLCHINHMLAILCHSCHYYNHSSPLSLGNQSCQDDWALGSVPVSSGGWSLVSSLVSASDQYQRPGARAGLRLRHRGQTAEDINPAPSNTPSLHLQTSNTCLLPPPPPPYLQQQKQSNQLTRCGLLKNKHTNTAWD